MSDALPPLNALRAFEAAARLLSFKKAAAELNVTPAAVSHQIKGLEEYLGVKLFQRLSRALELTDTARACVPKLTEGFGALAQAVDILRTREQGSSALTVSVAPSFAARWLMPRLHRFVTAHPEIDVRVQARMRQVNDAGTTPPRERETIHAWVADADLAIVYGRGGYRGLKAEHLLALTVAPICSTKLLTGIRPLRRAEDLRHFLLLHDDTGYHYDGQPFWEMWLRAAGAAEVDASHGPHFSHAALALEAAADGLGVVASIPALAEADISGGRLMLPFELQVPLAASYYMVCTEDAAQRPKVAAFCNWLRAEAKLSTRHGNEFSVAARVATR
jgi:LysR family glycine cleavage system transcriptional activator